MEKIQKYVVNGPMFVVIYIVFMLPTYILPYFRTANALANIATGNDGPNFGFLAQAACLLVLVLLTWARGNLVKKPWIVIFPVLASLFDLLPGLNLIPLIPTGMHLAAIIVGVSSHVVEAPTKS
jgi:hypothetical protein